MCFFCFFIYFIFSIKESIPTNRAEYFECYNIVRIIDHEIRKIENPNYRKKSKINNIVKSYIQPEVNEINFTQIFNKFSKNCEHLKDERKSVCKNILTEDNVRKMCNSVRQSQKPEFICSSIGYNKVSPSRSRIFSKKICLEIIDLIKNDFNKSTKLWDNHRPRINHVSTKLNLLEGNIQNTDRFKFIYKRKGSSFCRQYMGTPKYQQCLMLSRIAMSAASVKINEGNTSETICNYLESKNLIQLIDQDVNAFTEKYVFKKKNFQQNK